MDPKLRAEAEARLENAAKALDLLDPRAPYRDRLRLLKDAHNEAFRNAVAHYESVVLPALATGDDPLDTWIRYGAFLGTLSSDGRIEIIDATGRARAFPPPIATAELALFIPVDDSADVLVALQPRTPSAAQQATLDLLVHRQLAIHSE